VVLAKDWTIGCAFTWVCNPLPQKKLITHRVAQLHNLFGYLEELGFQRFQLVRLWSFWKEYQWITTYGPKWSTKWGVGSHNNLRRMGACCGFSPMMYIWHYMALVQTIFHPQDEWFAIRYDKSHSHIYTHTYIHIYIYACSIHQSTLQDLHLHFRICYLHAKTQKQTQQYFFH
jgi:hypothetical protein